MRVFWKFWSSCACGCAFSANFQPEELIYILAGSDRTGHKCSKEGVGGLRGRKGSEEDARGSEEALCVYVLKCFSVPPHSYNVSRRVLMYF